jgi:hypothetical protein
MIFFNPGYSRVVNKNILKYFELEFVSKFSGLSRENGFNCPGNNLGGSHLDRSLLPRKKNMYWLR